MNKCHVRRMITTEAKLVVIENIEFREKSRQTVIDKLLKNFGKNRDRSIVMDVLRITFFKDRYDLGNLQL